VTVATPIRAALNNLAHMCDNLGAIHGDYVRSALEAWDKLYEVEAENNWLREALREAELKLCSRYFPSKEGE